MSEVAAAAPARRAVVEVPGRVDPLRLSADAGLREAAVLAFRGWTVVLAEPVEVVDRLDRLARTAELLGWDDAPVAGRLPGAVLAGHVGDGCTPELLGLHGAPFDHPAGDRRPQPAPTDPVRMALHDVACWLPPDGDRALVVADDVDGVSVEPAARRGERMARLVAAHAGRRLPAGRPEPGAARPTLSPPAHRAAVRTARGWIAAGELYQLNLTFQVRAAWHQGPEALAAALWARTPGAAHAAMLRAEGAPAVVSASPETLLSARGRDVQVRPIKGTRPRGHDAAADRAAAEQLRASAKDAAEHVMIVDLERNDLGRVCEVGSVRVPDLARLEAHPTVWHLTSTVRGRLRAAAGLDDVLAALLPSGSVTGAPKRAAVTRTALLEPTGRGVYCGAVGLLAAGAAELSVAIRTAVLHDEVASYGTGGGIVADSDADAELAEARAKAEAFLAATGATLHD